MKKDPRVTAEQIIAAVGGKENIVSVMHCATRLRLSLKNTSKIDIENIKKAPGVAGYFEKSGQHQIILGTGFVNKVCDEVQKITGIYDEQDCQEVSTNETTGKFQQLTKMISDIFIPIIPVLLATGILMGLQSFMTNGLHIEFDDNLNTLFNVLTGTAYTFIPVLVTWSACKKIWRITYFRYRFRFNACFT